MTMLLCLQLAVPFPGAMALKLVAAFIIVAGIILLQSPSPGRWR